MNPPSRPLSAVLAEHAPRLMTMEGVVAVAEGENAAGRPCLKIWATGADRVRKRLPPAIDGYDVVVEESGPIEAMDSSAKAGR